jgi:thiamine-phosphate pyrophosphorylase
MRTRLYLITPPRFALEGFAAELGAALDAGDVAAVQLRMKPRDGDTLGDGPILAAAERLAPIVQARDGAFILNDRPDLARRVKADGVHVGQDDATLAQARALMGPGAIVGVTCHASRHLAMVAGEGGADYVAFGAFYPSDTKQSGHWASVDLLEWWQHTMEIPCVAIGGITIDNAEPIVRAGADFIAVSNGVWRHPEGPAAAVRAFNALFERCATGD